MASLRWGLLSTAAIGRLVVEATGGSDLTGFVAVAADADRCFAAARRRSPVVPRPGRGPSGPGS